MQNEKVAEEKFTNQEDLNATANSVAEDNASNGGTAENSKKENSPLDKLQNEVAEQKDKYIRLYSDFENFRRRSAKEKIDFVKSANEELIASLLPTLDDFERAVKANDKVGEESPLLEGIKLIYNKLYKTLEQKGLKPIDSKGNVFDVELHEAITQIPAPEESLKGKVIEEVEKGYFLNDKVIRFSKVIIGS